MPTDSRYDVYIDSDVILLRPMPLIDLTGPLGRGRIAAAVDEDTLSFIHAYESNAYKINKTIPGFREIGPLIQAGLIFSNRQDDGGLYKIFWQNAETAAKAGLLKDLPYDDMALLTVLMSQGASLWERFLPLGHHWNFITDAQKDPGLYAIGTHYGGRRAKKIVRDNMPWFTAPDNDIDAWGSVALAQPEGGRRFQSGLIRGHKIGAEIVHKVQVPFALSWIKREKSTGRIDISFDDKVVGSIVVLLGSEFQTRVEIDRNGSARLSIPGDTTGVITIISEITHGGAISVAQLRRPLLQLDVETV